MFTNNESRARAKNELQIAVIDEKRFAIEERNGNVCFNLTMMGKSYGVRPGDWLRTDKTQEYLRLLALQQKCDTADLIEVRQGGIPEKQGT